MIYIFIKRDRDNDRPYIDIPREYRTAKSVRQVLNLGGKDLVDRMENVNEGLFAIDGAKSFDDPELQTILKMFSKYNPGKSIELLESKFVAQTPPGECVIQSVSKNGVLPV